MSSIQKALPSLLPLQESFGNTTPSDYKGPDESMTISNYFKALSYAYSIPDYLNDSSAVNQVTLTLVSHRFPRKLIHYLQEKFSSTSSKILEKVSNGIYYMYNIYDTCSADSSCLSLTRLNIYGSPVCLKHITAETPLVNLRTGLCTASGRSTLSNYYGCYHPGQSFGRRRISYV